MRQVTHWETLEGRPEPALPPPVDPVALPMTPTAELRSGAVTSLSVYVEWMSGMNRVPKLARTLTARASASPWDHAFGSANRTWNTLTQARLPMTPLATIRARPRTGTSSGMTWTPW